MIFDVGDGVQLRHEVRNADGVLTAATVALTVTKPNGATLTPAVNTTSVGIYDADVVVADQAGPWRYVWSVTGAVVDVARGQFVAAASTPQAYVSLQLLREALGLGSTDGSRDELLIQAINAASRSIDDHTGRRFYADAVATARTFPLTSRIARDRDGELLIVDDIADATGIVIETGSAGSAAWTTLDTVAYELDPLNAVALGQPITGVRAYTHGWSWLPHGRVRITARWGWPTVPDVVTQAALIQASRLYARKGSPEGIAGSAEWGAVRVSRVDPDVQALLQNLVLPGFA